MDHVAGYSIHNEGSVREFQSHNRQFGLGKNFEASGSFGPWMMTPDEFGDPYEKEIITRLNGKERQHEGVNGLIFNVEALIHYISIGHVLRPGDVIVTGTPGALPPADDDIEAQIESHVDDGGRGHICRPGSHETGGCVRGRNHRPGDFAQRGRSGPSQRLPRRLRSARKRFRFHRPPPAAALTGRFQKMVRAGRLELPLCHQNWILNPARLPIPPRPRRRRMIAADALGSISQVVRRSGGQSLRWPGVRAPDRSNPIWDRMADAMGLSAA